RPRVNGVDGSRSPPKWCKLLRAGEGCSMRLFRLLIPIITALVVSAPAVTNAGGRLGMGRGHAFRGPSNSVSAFPVSPRAHRRFDRTPFGGTAVIPWEPNDIVVPV